MSKKKIKVTNPGKKNTWLYPWLCIAGIVVLTWFIYYPSLQNGFTNWDDDYYVTGNSLVVNNTVPVKQIFKTNIASNYHPLTILSVALDYQNARLNPREYHFVNVILHLLNTILVFLFVWLLTKRNLLMAAIVSLFFGIHPMHVESVAWVSERKDVLYVFFFLAGLITYLQYRQSKNIGWYISTILLFVLSCLSKGMAVIFPVVLLLIDYLLTVEWKPRIFIEKLPFFLLSFVFGVVAIRAQQDDQALTAVQSITFFQRILVGCYGVLMYLVKFFYPQPLSAFYPYPDLHKTLPILFYLSPLILVGIIALVYFLFRNDKPVVFGLLFYFISIALVAQVITVGGAVMADRYSYLAYTGLLMIAAYFIDKAWKQKSSVLYAYKYPLSIVVFIYAVALSYQTYARTFTWQNSETLWTDVITHYPTTMRAYELRGNFYHTAGQDDKALADYNKVAEINPQFLPSRVNRGIIYYTKGKVDSSLMDYNYSIATDTTYWAAYFNRGIYYDNLKPAQYELALADFLKSYRLRPADAIICNAVGVVYQQLEKYTECAVYMSKAIQLNPNVPNYWLTRSYAENHLGKNADAKADALQAQQLGMSIDTSYLNRLRQ